MEEEGIGHVTNYFMEPFSLSVNFHFQCIIKDRSIKKQGISNVFKLVSFMIYSIQQRKKNYLFYQTLLGPPYLCGI